MKGDILLLQVSIHQKDKAILNVHVSNERASKYLKQNLTEKKKLIHNYSWRFQNSFSST